MKKIVFISGVSSGLGKALSAHLSQKYKVLGSVRNIHDMDGQYFKDLGVDVFTLDIAVEESLEIFINNIAAHLKGNKLFAVVNNAGIAIPSAILATPVQAVKEQIAVNLLGTYSLTARLIPYIEQGTGRIINIGSVSSRLTAPFLASYSASKAGLSCFTKSWRMELAHLGIEVTQIDFGNINTDLNHKALPILEKSLAGIPFYHKIYSTMLESAKKRQANAMGSVEAAMITEGIIGKSRLRASYLVGKDARLMVFLQHILPYRLFERLLMKKVGFVTRSL